MLGPRILSQRTPGPSPASTPPRIAPSPALLTTMSMAPKSRTTSPTSAATVLAARSTA